MLETTIGKRNRNVPAAWDELSRGQVLAILKALFSTKVKRQAQLKILRILLDIPWREFFRIRHESIAMQLRLTDFIFSQNSLTKQLQPLIRVPVLRWLPWLLKRWYHGPGDNFKTLTVWEFVFSERCFLSFHKTQDPKDLDRLVAVLYRRKMRHYRPDSPDTDGDSREPFNENTVLHRLGAVAKADPWEKQLVLTWYTGCRWKLTQLYPHCFDPPKGSDRVRDKRKAPPNPWLDMLGDLPSEKFGTISQARHEKLHTVLYFLNKMIKDSKTQEK